MIRSFIRATYDCSKETEEDQFPHSLVNLPKIHKKLNVDRITVIFKEVVCECPDCKDLYAFCLGNFLGPRKTIYLGPKFWRAPNANYVFRMNSRVSTILHELSHFKDICGLVDHAQGAPEACVSLESQKNNYWLDLIIQLVNHAHCFSYYRVKMARRKVRML